MPKSKREPSIDKWEIHRLKGGDSQRARNQRCACGIIRENHEITHDGQLACPKVSGGKFIPESPKRKAKGHAATRIANQVAGKPEMTPEEFERTMLGFMMIVEGILKVAGVDGLLSRLDDFPDELDV